MYAHVCIYSSSVELEWDDNKAIVNRRSHGVDFADAATVFDDPLAVTMSDTSTDEERFLTLATDALGRVLVVIYTWRGETIRLISARKATNRERQQYDSGR